MKRVLSVRGAIAVLLLLVVVLSAGTALAGRQAGGSSAVSLTSKEGATIILSSTCVAAVDKKNPAQVTAWGSGWASGELILLSVIQDSENALIWYSGSVNPAGATEIVFSVMPSGKYSASERRPQAPATPGLYTLEALGTSGRLATYPIMFVEDKCE